MSFAARRIEAVRNAGERDQPRVPTQPMQRLLDEADRRRGVRGSADREERQRHAVDAPIVATERRIGCAARSTARSRPTPLSRSSFVTRLDVRKIDVVSSAPPSSIIVSPPWLAPKPPMRLVSTRSRHCGCARTTSIAADTDKRAQRLHRRVAIELRDRPASAPPRSSNDSDAIARVAVERRDDDVAVRCEHRDRLRDGSAKPGCRRSRARTRATASGSWRREESDLRRRAACAGPLPVGSG